MCGESVHTDSDRGRKSAGAPPARRRAAATADARGRSAGDRPLRSIYDGGVHDIMRRVLTEILSRLGVQAGRQPRPNRIDRDGWDWFQVPHLGHVAAAARIWRSVVLEIG